MPPPDGYVKAKLVVEGGDTIQALFNPTELSITKGNNWKFDEIKGKSLPKGKFGGGKPREMQVNLLLDQSLSQPAPGASVKELADKLLKMMDVPSGAGGGAANAVPPLVTFTWGDVPSFKAACTSLTITFNLFAPNGTPIRADVKLALTQAETATSASSNSANKKGNPTTRSEGGLGVHVIKDGDSLQSIAHRSYGDPNRWRLIAEANGIDNPLHLRRGTPLNLPRLD
jgi:Contractile injection system tube protein/LysM domain